jgi:hypothetical protein
MKKKAVMKKQQDTAKASLAAIWAVTPILNLALVSMPAK